jgi:hypothetical protein
MPAEVVMKSLYDKTTRLAALVFFSVVIPGTQGCSLPPPPEAWLEDGSGGGNSKPKVRTDSALSDPEMERFLLNARVITAFPAVIRATTSPMALEVEWEGEIRKAIFKYGHFESEGVERLPIDSYRHEVAAYLLDRVLGLKMVPVAVIRMVKTEGTLMAWVSKAFTEQQLRNIGRYPSDPQLLIQQQAVMKLFDALILNLSRRESDQLITPGEWKLHLIDHSRAFGTSRKLPESFVSKRASLPRSLLTNLEKLEEESLKILLDELLGDAQIEAMLERRDKILKKIGADRKQYGDAAVFQD